MIDMHNVKAIIIGTALAGAAALGVAACGGTTTAAAQHAGAEPVQHAGAEPVTADQKFVHAAITAWPDILIAGDPVLDIGTHICTYLRDGASQPQIAQQMKQGIGGNITIAQVRGVVTAANNDLCPNVSH
jgi:hypothetical protein